jgi:hypothetical protein
MSRFTTTVRSRLFYSLSPETAAVVGLSLNELQQAAVGRIALADWQIQRLANYFGIRKGVTYDTDGDD